jgi:hypothetical protein
MLITFKWQNDKELVHNIKYKSYLTVKVFDKMQRYMISDSSVICFSTIALYV